MARKKGEVKQSICLSFRELDHAMLRRLEKRILVNLPSEEARKQMLCHHLPPVINTRENGMDIKTEIDYDQFAKVE